MSALVHLQTERAVLGSVLAGATVSDTGPLPVESFGHPPHALIWQAMRDLDIAGKPVDHLTLAERLLAMPNAHGDGSVLAAVGGPAYLMSLDQVVPVPGNLATYCATLRDYATRRAIDWHADMAKAGARDLARRSPARRRRGSESASSIVRSVE